MVVKRMITMSWSLRINVCTFRAVVRGRKRGSRTMVRSSRAFVTRGRPLPGLSLKYPVSLYRLTVFDLAHLQQPRILSICIWLSPPLAKATACALFSLDKLLPLTHGLWLICACDLFTCWEKTKLDEHMIQCDLICCILLLYGQRWSPWSIFNSPNTYV